MVSSPYWGNTEILVRVEECSVLPREDTLMESESRSLGTNAITLPKWAVSTSFTSCVMAALGALIMHSFFEIVLAMQGGFTPWIPYLTLLMIVSIMSWRGSVAANGKGLGLSAFVPLLLIASIYLASVFFKDRQLHHLPENPPEELKRRLGSKLEWAALCFRKRTKLTEANIVVGISDDEIIDWAPILLPAALVATILFRVSTHRSVIPHQILQGSTPWCVMVGGCTWVAIEIYVTILQSGGVPQDMIGFIIVNLIAVLGCQLGLTLNA